MPEWIKNALSATDDATKVLMDFLGGVVPVASDARDVIGALSGYDIITGNTLTEQQQMDYAFFTLLPLMSGTMMRWGDELAGLMRSSDNISSNIANGHAFQKHIVEEGNFEGFIQNKSQFADYIKNVIENPTAMHKLDNGRVKYWDGKNEGIVIYDPKSSDHGTAFQAWDGRNSYDEIK